MNEIINRAARFYFEKSSKIYDAEYRRQCGIKYAIKPVFNYIRPAVNSLTSMSLKKDLVINNQDGINKILDDNNFQSLKFDLMIDMIIYEKAILYIDKNIDGTISISKPHPESIEIEKSQGKIIKLTSTGETYTQDAKGSLKKEKTRRIYWQESGVWYYSVDGVGKEVQGLYLPYAIFETNYDIDGMIDIIDNMNKHQHNLNNIFDMHGNPILKHDAAVGTVANSKIETQDGFVFFESDKLLSYVEMQGNVAQLTQADKNELKKALFEQYPECNLAELSNGSNISEQTMLIKFADIIAKVTSLRSEYTAGLLQLCNIINYQKGLSPITTIAIDYGKVLPEIANIDFEVKLIDALIKYKGLDSEALFREFRERMLLPEFKDYNQFVSGL
ncbi:MAG TPA: hypothetical protein DCS19_00405 [Flavobacterium sp.]|nr:hypothetical protein [Flavobacterium sp.]